MLKNMNVILPTPMAVKG